MAARCSCAVNANGGSPPQCLEREGRPEGEEDGVVVRGNVKIKRLQDPMSALLPGARAKGVGEGGMTSSLGSRGMTLASTEIAPV